MSIKPHSGSMSVTARLDEVLKRFDSVVIPVRFARHVRMAWSLVKEDRRHEKQRRGRLLARDEQIRAYFKDKGRPRKLHIGAGTYALDGWLNTDLEPQSEAVMFLDALEVFPFDSQVFDYAFSEHMIEHVSYKDGLFVLREVFRVLKPGGRLRIATPDVERIAGLLCRSKSDAQAEYIRWSVQEVLGLYADQHSKLQQQRPEWRIDPGHIRRFFPDAGRDCACFVVNNFFRSYGHQFLYDAGTLTAAIEGAGFVDVKEAVPGQSADRELNAIESHGMRCGDAANDFETMVFEAVRP